MPSLGGAGSEAVRLCLDHSRPPMTIEDLTPWNLVMAFMEFAINVLSQQERGDPVPEDEVWKHEVGYMKWFYRVSHPCLVWK